jgi:hypothetical protein
MPGIQDKKGVNDKYVFGVQPASYRWNPTMRGRTNCLRDAGSTFANPAGWKIFLA